MPVGRAGSDKAHTEYNHHVLTRQTVRRTAHEEASKQGRGNRSHNPVIQAFSNMHAAQFAASQARRETLAVVQIDMQQSSPATWQGAWTEALFPGKCNCEKSFGLLEMLGPTAFRRVWLAVNNPGQLVQHHISRQATGNKRKKN